MNYALVQVKSSVIDPQNRTLRYNSTYAPSSSLLITDITMPTNL